MHIQDTSQRNETKQGPSSTMENNVSNGKIRVFLVDDHPLIRVGMTEMLGREEDIEVCGEAASIAQAMALIEECNPSVVTVDISLAGEDGFDLVKRIHARRPEIFILIYTMHGDDLWMRQAIQAGADAYVRKIEAPENLIKTIRVLSKS